MPMKNPDEPKLDEAASLVNFFKEPIETPYNERWSNFDKYVVPAYLKAKYTFLSYFTLPSGDIQDYKVSAARVAEIETEEETPWGRVKKIFRNDEEDYPSSEWLFIKQSCYAAGFVGFPLGCYRGGKGIKERFIQYHKATIWERSLDARARMADTIVLHAFRGGCLYMAKLVIITFGFTYGTQVQTIFIKTLARALSAAYTIVLHEPGRAVSIRGQSFLLRLLCCGTLWHSTKEQTRLIRALVSSVAAYRGQSGILEYTIAGGLGGAFYRANMGMPGMLAASAVGGVLGTVGGSMLYGTLKVSGRTYEEMAYWRKIAHVNRLKYIMDKTEREALARDSVSAAHNELVAERQEQINRPKSPAVVQSAAL